MAATRYQVQVGEASYDVEIAEQDGQYLVRLGDRTLRVDLRRVPSDFLLSALADAESIQALANLQGEAGTVVLRGVPIEVTVQDERAARLASLAGKSAHAAGMVTLKAPMPGLVVKVNVAAGEQVEKGEPLVVLQAMKMENELAAPRAGTVKQVQVQSGQTVEHGQVLVVLE
jgi:biotin carboxyl carrier protein